MYETPEDLERLQSLLDASYAAAGTHLRSISTEERQVSAADLAARLTGVRLLALATSTADGRPMVGMVDGLFYRGEFYFGSGADSVRFRHLRKRPAVSAVHADGEPFSVTVHGKAEEIDLVDPATAGFREYCTEIYGSGWLEWVGTAPYARIAADKMFTFYLDPAEAEAAAGAGGET